MKSPTKLFSSCHCSGVENFPSRLIYSTCWTAEIFAEVGFLIRLELEMIHCHEGFLLSEANRRFKEQSDWQNFFATKRRPDAAFLAFHFVKCGSEHFRLNLLSHILAHLQKTACTTFAQFFVHCVTITFSCVIIYMVSKNETKTD